MSGFGIPTRSRSSAARAAAALRLMSKWVSRGSRSCRPIVSTGFRLVIGSWKIIAICRPRTRRSARWLRWRRSRPSNRAEPERTRPARGSRPSSASAVALFPQPDSPTMPSVSPAPISNEIPFTACTVPLPVQKWTRRSSTARSDASGTADDAPAEEPERLALAEAPDAAAELRVERFPQAVADEVESEHRDDDRDAGNDGEERRRLEVVVHVGEHRPPLRRCRVLRAEAEEAEPGDVDDRRGHRERSLDDHGRDRVREDVREEDHRAPDAHRPRREHEVVLALREHRAAEEPREDRDVHDPDRNHDLLQAGAERRHDPDRKEQTRDGEHDVHAAHDQRVHDAAEVAGERAEDEPDREPDRDGHDADHERVAGAVEDAAEDVATELVDAEQVVPRRARAAAARD